MTWDITTRIGRQDIRDDINSFTTLELQDIVLASMDALDLCHQTIADLQGEISDLVGDISDQ